MAITAAVDNASETTGDLNKEAWDKYNLLRLAVLVEHDTDGTHLSTGDVVLKALFDANTILAANSDNTPAALTIAASRILGRASTGNIAALTAAQVNTILSTATKALDNLASVAINTSLISDTDDTDDLGSAAKQWKDLYIDGTANIDALIADTADINGGTIDGITALTAAGHLDIGTYGFRANTLTADGLTATRVVFAGANGLLSDAAAMTFVTDTLTVTKLGAFQAAGAINFGSQNMTNVDIDSGTIGGVTLDGAITGGDQAFTNVGDMTFHAASILKSGSTGADTLLLAANDTTFITLTTGTPDTLGIGAFTLSGKLTAGASEIEGSAFDINGGTIGGITFDGALTMSLGSDADGDVYYRASNVLTRLAKGTASKVLAMNSGATAPEWTAIAVKDADADTMIQVEESADEDIIRMDVAGTEVFHLSAAGILTLVKQSGGRAYNTSANQRLANGSVTLALFDSENFDHQNEWDTSVVDGTATATTSDKLVDTGNFTEADAYYVGRWVYNTVDYTYAIVTAKDSDDQLSIDTDIMADTETYKLYRSRFTVTEDGTYMIALSGAGKEIAAGKQVVDRLYINGVQKQVSALYNDGAGDRDISALLLACWQLSASDYVELRLWHDDTGTQQFYNEDHRTWMSVVKVD